MHLPQMYQKSADNPFSGGNKQMIPLEEKQGIWQGPIKITAV